MSSVLFPSLLTWLRAFDAAARHGSFTVAAADLHVTQGAVSQQVKNLEEWLGAPLFHRAPRKLILSESGLRLKQIVDESFRSLESGLAQMRLRSKEGALSLNCSPSFAMRWLTPRVSHLSREHPDISLRIYGEFHTLDKIRMEQDGIEAAIRFDPGEYSDVRAVKFLDEWLVPVASPGFMAAHPSIDEPSRIPSNVMLHDTMPWEEAQDGEEWDTWLGGMGLPAPAHHDGQRFNMSQIALSAALSGQGIAMGRLALVLEDLMSGRLLPLFGHAVASRASYHYVAAPVKNTRLERIEAWLLNEGRLYRQQRNVWCEKNGVKMLVRA